MPCTKRQTRAGPFWFLTSHVTAGAPPSQMPLWGHPHGIWGIGKVRPGQTWELESCPPSSLGISQQDPLWETDDRQPKRAHKIETLQPQNVSLTSPRMVGSDHRAFIVDPHHTECQPQTITTAAERARITDTEATAVSEPKPQVIRFRVGTGQRDWHHGTPDHV